MPKRKSNDGTLLEQSKRQAIDSNEASEKRFESYCLPSNAGKATFDACTHDLRQLNYQGAISKATLGIHDMLDSLLALLDMRALTYSKTMQIDKGLEDAQQIITYAPTAAAGYLRAGSLYTLNSKYQEAMQVYEQGLAAVPEQFSHVHAKLQEGYKTAKARKDRRIDYITRLPFDIACHVMDYLPTHTLLQALGVCREWRDRLRSYGKVWTHTQLSSYLAANTLDFDIANLACVSQHIIRLDLYDLNNQYCEKMFMMMMKGNYRKIKTLKFTLCTLDNYGRCMVALWQLKDTLQELHFSMDRDSPLVPLGVVLSTCQNLTALRCIQCYTAPTAQALGSFPTEPINSLVDLEVSFKSMSAPLLDQLLRCCPRLRQLSIRNCVPQAARIVRNRCPDLRALGLNTMVSVLLEQKQQVFAPTGCAGIRHLAIFLAGDEDLLEHLQYLVENAHVLETLSLICPRSAIINGAATAHWQVLTPLMFHNLRTLSISFTDDYNRQVVPNVLRHCPNLQELSFSTCTFVDSDVFAAIQDLHRLEKLVLDDITLVDEDGITLMFEAFGNRCRQQQEGCQHIDLRTIDISDCAFSFTDAMLRALARIPSLHHMNFNNLECTDEGVFERFTKTLREQSTIRTIILSGIDCATNEALQHLNATKSLTGIELYGLKNVTQEGVECLYANSKISIFIDL
ncbi:hypothetical protein BDB00DRAFT_874127 [Zychaea mexicana]|uniref:uncharacterized protein n=1 Tax=Zychaea mexicana TaxID=64656 RepID=UPI0022FDF12F|nr:uncharacterized protein BDB00DRAFT_874127 [Zychaea mexicana]KAI9491560.1 hypothetical protein BDB00DRAFT_874127 [Zychaea mexicana]